MWLLRGGKGEFRNGQGRGREVRLKEERKQLEQDVAEL